MLPEWVMQIVLIAMVLVGLMLVALVFAARLKGRSPGSLPTSGLQSHAAGEQIKQLDQRAESTGTLEERIERRRQARGMSNDLRDLMTQIEELSRHLADDLEHRQTRLEKLVQLAEKTIERLEQLQAHESQRSARALDVLQPMSETQDSAPAPVPTAAKLAALANQRLTKAVDLNDSTPQPDSSGQDDPLARRVYALADQGIGPPDIARQLQEHVGKVELILALREA